MAMDGESCTYSSKETVETSNLEDAMISETDEMDPAGKPMGSFVSFGSINQNEEYSDNMVSEPSQVASAVFEIQWITYTFGRNFTFHLFLMLCYIVIASQHDTLRLILLFMNVLNI